MDLIRRFTKPSLRSPRALIAWEGWNDACEAATGAVTYFLGQFPDTEAFAVIEPEEFYDFQVRRPRVETTEGGTRSISWPHTQVFAAPVTQAARDVVVVLGEEPNLKWKTYTRTLAQILAESDVEIVLTLGAFIGRVAHTRPVPVIGVATDPKMVEDLDLMASTYEGPTGIVAVMLEACREVGIPAISLWAATPHYLAANPNPKAMLALLSKASQIMEVPMDLAELEEAATEFEDRVDEAMAEDEEFVEYVRGLEQETAVSPLDPNRSDRLISEIESFLKER